MMKTLAEKNVVVTGAGGGLGRAISLAFASEGARVIAVDIDLAEAEKTAAALWDGNCDCLPLSADATRREECADMAARVLSECGRVDILMNCVGIGVGGRLSEFSLEDWEKAIEINLMGTLVPLYSFLPHMLERKSGHIATISSASGLLASPFTAPYNMTKFALVGLGDAMRGELAGFGIGVTTICPTAIRTRFMEHAIATTTTEGDRKVRRALIKTWEKAYDPDKAARLIVEGIKKNKPMIIIGNEIRFLYWLKRMSPWLYYKILEIGGKLALRFIYK
jgi:NAD(P)-dependent dehydrogenase (short-subunit alcohol dehydrogenase family)